MVKDIVRSFGVVIAGALIALGVGGCGKGETRRAVVLYTSVDEPYVRGIVGEFEKAYHIRVDVRTDAEATKTVGLAERLRAEKGHPVCDVYWGNEVFNTINLAEEGILTGYAAPNGAEIPALYKDPGNRWFGTGLRARVMAVSDTAPEDAPRAGLEDLLDPAYRGRVAMARPTAGTTGGQVAALYWLWGKEKAEDYFRKLQGNGVKLVGGNSVVAEMVGSGQMLIGLTDNDDCQAAKQDGGKLEMVLPDQAGQGTLTMPSTVGLVAGAPDRAEGEELMNYLLSKEVEEKLIEAGFAGWSVRGKAGAGPGAGAGTGAGGIKAMHVDYRAVARGMPEAIRSATAILEGR